MVDLYLNVVTVMSLIRVIHTRGIGRMNVIGGRKILVMAGDLFFRKIYIWAQFPL